MNKEQFLEALLEHLAGLPMEDIDRALDYYSEMIDDRMEDGLSEAEAVAAAGDPAEIASQIVSSVPMSRLVRERLRPARDKGGWSLALLILGAPLWFPLLLAAYAVVLSLLAALWSILIALYAVDLALAVSAIACAAASVWLICGGHFALFLFAVGAIFVCAGLAVLFYLGCGAIGKGLVWLCRYSWRAAKSVFVRKGEKK